MNAMQELRRQDFDPQTGMSTINKLVVLHPH
uniref:Uncharacterized protein n=1 Tax=Rhizophora mucronata TaxID=61149 RepID=A0A2P2N668_RHIMU